MLITRSIDQSASFAAALSALGAEVVAIPTITIVPPPNEDVIRDAIAEIDSFSWIVLTSVNAVDRFCDYMREAGAGDVPAAVGVAVVGPATAAALAAHNVAPSLIPADYRAEGLIEEFDRIGPPAAGERVLFPRALKAREILPDHLRALGYEVLVAPVYETVPATFSPEQIGQLHAGVDGIAFTSPSTARNFFSGCTAAGIGPREWLAETAVFSIGPVTTDALLDLGLDRDHIIEAASSTTQDMVRAVRDHLSQQA